LLTTEGSFIKHSREVLNFLKAVFLPKQISVIHCPRHQRSEDQVTKGNQRADVAVKEAARSPYVQAPLLESNSSLLPLKPCMGDPFSKKIKFRSQSN
jgi:hypothetical protein